MCRAFDFQLALVTLLSRLVLLTLLLATLAGLVLPALLLLVHGRASVRALAI